MEVEKEIWRDVVGYEGLYKVSSLGRVKSLERKVKWKNGYRTVSERILKPEKTIYGYLQVALYNREGKRKFIRIHQLVCNAFIDNQENLPQINHRNEIKSDNRLENLEFCTAKYNVNYGSYKERMSKAQTNNTKKSKPVKCVETGIVFPSTMEIQRQLGFSQAHICDCCNGKRKSAYGYNWCYVE